MNQLRFSIDLHAAADERAIMLAKEIEERVARIPQVDAASATTNATRLTGAEIVAGIALAVSVAEGVNRIAKTLPGTTEAITQTVAQVREMIAEFRKLARDIEDIKAIRIKDGFNSIALDELTDEQIDAMVRRKLAAEHAGTT